jgi:lipoprotein NlpI
VAKDPKNPEVFMTYGTMLRLGGKPDQALAAFDSALKLKPDHRNAHIEKAYVEISRGKYARGAEGNRRCREELARRPAGHLYARPE